ncbi:YlbL family protein [Jonesia quinghaiensis]|uniref:YlbL family protein n=1 Tax=Jonesia quinghaiensis TaxID=262806 RepID=UPI000419167D|nr:S16 family serine protease [Jonesia quinghaiensis]
MSQNQPDARPTSRRNVTFAVSTLVTALLVAALMWVPSPYVVRTPGPTKDVLGEVNSRPLISISGEDTFDPSGELLLTTVGVQGGPSASVSFAQVIQGWLDPKRAVYPVETVYPPESTQEEIETVNTALMVTSQENATYAALSQLGYSVPTTLAIQEVLEESEATGTLQSGDVLVSLNGQATDTYESLVAQLDAMAGGDEVDVVVERDGELVSARFPTIASSTSEGARLGLTLDITFDFPVDVDIEIDNIGGPSAGMIFALGIMDMMTSEDELNGEKIAGTGTMDTTGQVGAIGGIRQKLNGAVRDGASYFLAPASNCEEVVGYIPEGLDVIAVDTLSSAWDAVQAIGAGDTSELTRCQ